VRIGLKRRVPFEDAADRYSADALKPPSHRMRFVLRVVTSFTKFSARRLLPVAMVRATSDDNVEA